MAHLIPTPLGLLVAARMRRLGIGRAVLADRMGFADHSSLRLVDRMCVSGHAEPELLNRLAMSLDLPLAEVESARARTRKQIEDETEQREREAFQPHILIETPGRPQVPIFVAALAWEKEKVIQLPREMVAWKLEDQLRLVRQKIALHRQEHGSMLKGWGPITGYTFHRTYDHRMGLTVDGEVVEPFAAPGQTPPTLTIGNKTIRAGHIRAKD